MSKQAVRFIVLTGPPGSGKTTLVKKVCDDLRAKNYALDGFFTEEVRNGRDRVGFDVVLLNGKRAPLARVSSGGCTGPMVGKYAVDVRSFESCILPVFSSENGNTVWVLDEIGKMELFSERFKDIVHKCINTKRSVILATVPVKTARPIPLIEMVKGHPETCLITVTRENRNDLVDKITNLILNIEKTTVPVPKTVKLMAYRDTYA